MIFDVEHDRSGPAVPSAGWVRASREVLADVVRRPEDLRVLCEAGFPQGPFRMAPPIASDDCAAERSSVVDLGSEVEVAARESGDLLLFGAMQGWYLFLHLGDGTVHAFPDGIALFDGDFRPVHADLSSLRHLLVLLERRELWARHEHPGGSGGSPYAELDRFADGVRAEFDGVDPAVFGEESPWLPFFGDIRGGLYQAYCHRLPPGRP